MNYKKIAAALCLAGAFLCSAGEVYKLDRVEDWHNRSSLTQQAPGVLRGKGRIVAFSKEIYPYDAKKTYTFKGLYRQLPGSDSNIFRVGILPLDKDKKVIEFVTSHPKRNTDTVLAKAAAAGDTFIIVKDGSGWERNAQVAYNTKPDLSDLPNKNIIAQNPQIIEKTEDGWKITFIKPVGIDLPAGTAVRQHHLGGRFRFAGNGTGGDVLSDLKCKRWDVGTKYFLVVVMSGTNGIKPGEQVPVLEMKNPRIEVTE